MTAGNPAASSTLTSGPIDFASGAHDTPFGTTIGVTGLRPRWSVSDWGAVWPWESPDPSAALEWFVAADDRWHVPAQEPTVRQRRIEGTPVLETRVRIPDGDAVQRVWAVPERGGMVVVEFENESPLPVAIAVAGLAVVTERPTSDVPIQGIELPDDAVVLPLGHHATVRVLIPATDASGDFVPVPPALSVVRGWTRVTEQASRLVVPDEALVEAAVAARCDLLLEGPVAPHDPVGFVLDVAELVRCGDDAAAWLLEVVEPAERIAKTLVDGISGSARAEALDALRSAAFVARRAGDDRACADILRMVGDLASGSAGRRGRFRRNVASERSESAPDGSAAPAPSSFAEVRRSTSVGRFVRSIERRIVEPTDAGREGSAVLLPGGVPTAWLGSNFEVHGVPTGSRSTVSFAVRWHGERPALLWEQHGPPVTLASPTIDESWSTSEPSGETLLAAPEVAASVRSSLLVTSADDAVPLTPNESTAALSGGIVSVDPDGGTFA